MESMEMLNKVNEIGNSLKRIENILKEKEDNRTIHSFRIGALNRISDAVKFIDDLLTKTNDPFIISSLFVINSLLDIKRILNRR